MCVISVVRQCFMAGMWVIDLDPHDFNHSLCRSVSFSLLFLIHHFHFQDMCRLFPAPFIPSLDCCIFLLWLLPLSSDDVFTLLLFSCVCRSQRTWDIGVQTVIQGHRPRLPWLLPLLLWPWRQSKIHLTSSVCPSLTFQCPYMGSMWSIFSQSCCSVQQM